MKIQKNIIVIIVGETTIDRTVFNFCNYFCCCCCYFRTTSHDGCPRLCLCVAECWSTVASGEVERASDEDWSGVVPGGGGGGGGAAGGLVLHCCCCGAGQDDGRRDTHTPGTRMGPRLFRQPTNTTGGSSGGGGGRNVNTTAAAER
ncbi:unnamed protein product [Aphis gossypii]|uniref:Uncharacterized protein n=1 Tax=Aphis gossypii TaxID=80765 RepID=A0A9P0NSD9_APHGO|nr:unnamed protein product [Aphis gossypii]